MKEETMAKYELVIKVKTLVDAYRLMGSIVIGDTGIEVEEYRVLVSEEAR